MESRPVIKSFRFLLATAAELGGTNLCADQGHALESIGGRTCPKGWQDCSQTVYECIRCGMVEDGARGDLGWKECQTCPRQLYEDPEDIMSDTFDVEEVKARLFDALKKKLMETNSKFFSHFLANPRIFLPLYTFFILIPENRVRSKDELWFRMAQNEAFENLKLRFKYLDRPEHAEKLGSSSSDFKRLITYVFLQSPVAEDWDLASLLALKEFFKEVDLYLQAGSTIDAQEVEAGEESGEKFLYSAGNQAGSELYQLQDLSEYFSVNTSGYLSLMEDVSVHKPANYFHFLLAFDRFNRALGWPELDVALQAFLQKAEFDTSEAVLAEVSRDDWTLLMDIVSVPRDEEADVATAMKGFAPHLCEDWDIHTLYRPQYLAAFLERHFNKLSESSQAVLQCLLKRHFDTEDHLSYGNHRDLLIALRAQIEESFSKNPQRFSLSQFPETF